MSSDKSNEITAIPELLGTLDIKGAIITIDTMGCQHDIATEIVSRGADYVLGVKDNQPGLAEAIRLWFEAAETGTLDRPFWDHSHTEKDHGRIETRRCLVTDDVDWLGQQNQHWAGVQSLIMIESTREVIGRNSSGTASVERRFYISSLPAKAGQSGAHCACPPGYRKQHALGARCRISRGRLPHPGWRRGAKLRYLASNSTQFTKK